MSKGDFIKYMVLGVIVGFSMWALFSICWICMSEVDIKSQMDVIGLILSVGGLIVTGLGIYYVAGTLEVTRDAVIAANENTRHESRAYVHVEKMEVWWGGRDAPKPRLIGTAKNSGQTPAKWFKIQHYIFTSLPDERPTDKVQGYINEARKKSFRQWNALGGSSELSFYSSSVEDAPIIKSVYTKTDIVFNVCGVIRYKTFFDEVFETEFWFSRLAIPDFKPAEIHEIIPNGAKFMSGETPHPLARAMCNLKNYELLKQSLDT